MTIPQDFADYTRRLMGKNLYTTLERALGERPSVSVRMNRGKISSSPCLSAFDKERVPWCPDGFYLSERPDFTFDPLFHAGAYYVQEASSMFIDEVLRQHVNQPVTMLDLCAAPGGKSIASRAVLPEESMLFSNEPVHQRAMVLSENIQKFGHEGVVVTSNHASDYAKSGLTFDVILSDVPCSGEGMFRKDEFAIRQWSENLVQKCHDLQRQIVGDIWPCLRPGGLLIYSTCTYNAHEDEENVNWIANELGAELQPVEVPAEWNITGSLVDGVAPVYRFVQGLTRGEGLFMAVLRKNGEASQSNETARKKSTTPPKRHKSANIYDKAGQWLDNSVPMTLIHDTYSVAAIPTIHADICRKAMEKLHVVHAGVTLCTIKGKNIVPTQALALSRRLDTSAFASVELDYDTAIKYLRKDTIVLHDSAIRNYILLTYGGIPLGFCKNIGARANNLYPSTWKIRSTHVPENARTAFQKTWRKIDSTGMEGNMGTAAM